MDWITFSPAGGLLKLRNSPSLVRNFNFRGVSILPGTSNGQAWKGGETWVCVRARVWTTVGVRGGRKLGFRSDVSQSCFYRCPKGFTVELWAGPGGKGAEANPIREHYKPSLSSKVSIPFLLISISSFLGSDPPTPPTRNPSSFLPLVHLRWGEGRGSERDTHYYRASDRVLPTDEKLVLNSPQKNLNFFG